MTDLKLGKRPAREDKRDILFADYRAPGTLQPAPVGFGEARVKKVTFGMNGNGPDNTVRPGFQGAGDCVLADAGHVTTYLNALAGHTVIVTGKESIADYSHLTGYVIGDDATDQGTDMRAALNFRRKTGILDHAGKRHKIYGYVALEPTNHVELQEALRIFDAVSIGFNFQAAQMDQFNAGHQWTYVKGSPNEGGHDVPVLTRHTITVNGCVSWARVQPFTKSFYTHLNDEAYGIISQESVVNGHTPEGVLWADLLAAVKQFPSGSALDVATP